MPVYPKAGFLAVEKVIFGAYRTRKGLRLRMDGLRKDFGSY